MTIDTTPNGHRHQWVRLWGSAEIKCFAGGNCYAELYLAEAEQRINAFPDLLAALESLRDAYTSPDGALGDEDMWTRVAAAIAKAKGEGEPS